MKGFKPISLMLTLALVLGVSGMPSALALAEPAAHVFILQTYGGGEEQDGTPISHSFIELYNPTQAPVDLGGYKIVYHDKRDAENHVDWQAELSGELAAGVSYLLRGQAMTDLAEPALQISGYDKDMPDNWLDNKEYEVKLLNGSGDTVDEMVYSEVANKHTARRRTSLDGTGDERIDYRTEKGMTPEKLETIRPRGTADGAWNPFAGADGEEPVPTRPKLSVSSVNGNMEYLGSYWTGKTDGDGAIAEIVKFNPENQKMYMVNGALGSLDIVSLAGGGFDALTLEKRVDVAALGGENGFPCGDITSVDVNTGLDVIAIATQFAPFGEAGHTENGAVVFLDYDGAYIAHFAAGVQPDMIGFSPDFRFVMTANEGEPRDVENDPAGSVTIIDLGGVSAAGQLKTLDPSRVQTVGFDAFDSKRAELVADGVLLKPGVDPSLDLEPEYVAFAGGTAYVSLQEANSVAAFDLASKTFTNIHGLGFKDHSLARNALDLNDDDVIKLQTEENVLGVYMPDGLAAVTIGGKTYLLTPNEGDARDDWYDDDLLEASVNGSEEVEYLNHAARDGLDPGKVHLLGGRSFSVWDADTMELIFDSGSDFERIVSEEYPEIFNSDHAGLGTDGRSDRKGPEPEDIKVAEIAGRIFAFIGLERVGGLMMYDITTPANPLFYDYLNVRDLTDGGLANGSDLGAEGICIISAAESPTGKPMALVANEVSGSVTLIGLTVSAAPVTPPPDGGDDGGSYTPPPATIPADGGVPVDFTQSGGEVMLTLPDSKVSEIIAKADDGSVTLDVSGVSGAKSVTLDVDAAEAFSGAGVSVTVDLPAGEIT
ncbi:MAG: lamin tail domain-containing protein, partial [Oscillospiraceae bacterium]|nr:lamin tail domain-containing protein [Oscillospiraceae bacterium]